MKKALTLLLLAVMVCTLTACGCSHEWTEASCGAPKTCALCGETEGEALGHDFAAATCTAGETCTRCGETKGEALGHTFAEATCTEGETCTRCGEVNGEALGHAFTTWHRDSDEQMSRSCDVCGEKETAPLDNAAILNSKLLGQWDLYYILSGGQEISAHYFGNDMIGMALRVTGDNTGIFYSDDDGYPMDVKLVYEDYALSDGWHCYYFTIYNLSDEPMISGWYGEAEGASSGYVYMLLGEGEYAILDRFDYLSGIAGTYVAAGDGKVNTITLNEDRTFTASVGEELSGTWHLLHPTSGSGYRFGMLKLCYVKDGQTYIVASSFGLGSEDTPLEDYLNDKDHLYMNPYSSSHTDLFDNLGTFYYASEAALEMMEIAPTLPLGNWTSSTVSKYQAGVSEDTLTDAYSITFNEDGTFTAVLDEERSGTWTFNSVTDNGVDYSASYYLNIEGIEDSVYMSVSNDGMQYVLYLSTYDEATEASTSVYFYQ